MNTRVLGPLLILLPQCLFDRLQKYCARAGLLRKVLGARLHCLDAGLDVPFAGKQHKRKQGRPLAQLTLQLQAGQARHLQVEQDAARLTVWKARQKPVAGVIGTTSRPYAASILAVAVR